MKITSSPLPATFTPVSITITMESQDEVDAIYALFHATVINDAVRDVFAVDLPWMPDGPSCKPKSDSCARIHSVLARRKSRQ